MKKLTALFALVLVCGFLNLAKSQSSVKQLLKVSNLTAYNLTDNTLISTGDISPVILKKTTSLQKANLPKTDEAVLPDAIEASSSIQFKYAMIMDVAVEALKDFSLYNFIEDWYGTHYRMGGSTKRGIDCSAFTSTLLLAVYSLTIPRTAREQYKVSEHIDRDKLHEGDLVFFNTHGGISHVGIYLSNNYFVHSSSSNGVMISSLEDSYYSNRFISGGRVLNDRAQN